MAKVFMDGGRRINILFVDTLRKMGRSLTYLTKSDSTFHDIVPGKEVHREGTITLEDIFGTHTHFIKETIDWKSQYHAILGRLASARFVAAPHYTYVNLKMAGPNGTIAVSSDFQRSDKCDLDFSKISKSFGMQKQQLEELSLNNDKTLLLESKRPAPDAAFTAINDTRAY